MKQQTMGCCLLYKHETFEKNCGCLCLSAKESAKINKHISLIFFCETQIQLKPKVDLLPNTQGLKVLNFLNSNSCRFF